MIKLQTTIDRPFAPANNPVRIFVDVVFAGLLDGGRSQSPVSSYVLLDCSGSMQGQKISCAKLAVSEYIKSLRSIDDLTLITFGGNVRTILRKQEMTEDGRSDAISLLNKVVAESGTPMFGAVKGAFDDIKSSYAPSNSTNLPNNRVLRLVLVTDGQPTDVDPETNLKEFVNIARGLRIHNTTLICLGIGDDYDEDLLLKLYQANEGGQIEHITDPVKQMSAIFSKISSDAKNVIFPSAKLQVKLNQGVTFEGAYKIAPQTQEMTSSFTSDGKALTFQVGDVIAGGGPELCMSFSLPVRSTGEFREVSFMVEGNSNISSDIIVNRVLDSKLIANRHDPLPESKYREANENILAIKVMQGEKKPIELTQLITKYRNDPTKTRLMSPDHVQALEKAEELSKEGKAADHQEIMQTKIRMTKIRGQGP